MHLGPGLRSFCIGSPGKAVLLGMQDSGSSANGGDVASLCGTPGAQDRGRGAVSSSHGANDREEEGRVAGPKEKDEDKMTNRSYQLAGYAGTEELGEPSWLAEAGRVETEEPVVSCWETGGTGQEPGGQVKESGIGIEPAWAPATEPSGLPCWEGSAGKEGTAEPRQQEPAIVSMQLARENQQLKAENRALVEEAAKLRAQRTAACVERTQALKALGKAEEEQKETSAALEAEMAFMGRLLTDQEEEANDVSQALRAELASKDARIQELTKIHSADIAAMEAETQELVAALQKDLASKETEARELTGALRAEGDSKERLQRRLAAKEAEAVEVAAALREEEEAKHGLSQELAAKEAKSQELVAKLQAEAASKLGFRAELASKDAKIQKLMKIHSAEIAATEAETQRLRKELLAALEVEVEDAIPTTTTHRMRLPTPKEAVVAEDSCAGELVGARGAEEDTAERLRRLLAGKKLETQKLVADLQTEVAAKATEVAALQNDLAAKETQARELAGALRAERCATERLQRRLAVK